MRPGDHTGRSSSASGGIVHVLRGAAAVGRNLDAARPAGAVASGVDGHRREDRQLGRATGRGTAASRSTLGNIVLAIRISESSTSTPMITLATAFSHGGFDHGPSTSRSLQSSSRNTVALGSSTPASACTEVVIRPSGALRDQHDARRPRPPSARSSRRRASRRAAAVERVLGPEHVAERVGGRERDRRRADQRGVQQHDREERPGGRSEAVSELGRDRARIGEVAEVGGAGERERRRSRSARRRRSRRRTRRSPCRRARS